MDIDQWQTMLLMLKTLSDENRLKMLHLMHRQERTVTEMAGLLELSEPTISHHVSKLHGAGLLRLRMAGNQRFYQVNEAQLQKFKMYVNAIETAPEAPEVEVSDNEWIEALDWDEADKKVLRAYTVNKRLIPLFPTKDKKMMVILRWLATFFQPGVRYTEKQVNAIITEVHQDYATLRRSLVEYGFMRRERGGGDYWLTPDDTPHA